MADPLWGQQLTDMWMLDPTMFDPTQRSNQFSNYNNAPLPGPSYNTGAGGPTNAMGQPIASFQAWQAANPGGMGINNTPAQPQAPAAPAMGGTPAMSGPSGLGPGIDALIAQAQAAQAGQQQTPYGRAGTNPFATASAGGASPQQLAGMFSQMSPTIPGTNQTNPNYAARMGQLMAGIGPGQQAAAPQGAAGAGGAPNNWMAALNALSNPGNPVTPGATVPMAQGFQPAGGVNAAFLGQAPRTGNRNFLSALNAIQGRPQG
jgi:hypothetical protein